MMVAGVLVCGGNSTRFGEVDKVCADLVGRPLIQHVIEGIAPAVDELIISCREAQHDCLENAMTDSRQPVRYVFDAKKDVGPLHGIERGLSVTEAEYAAVVACDMPFVDSDVIELLIDRAQGHDVAIPREAGDWYQPLQAVYRVQPMLDAIEEAFEAGIRRPIKPALELDAVTVDESEFEPKQCERTFFNVNTREDLETAHDMFEAETK